MLFVMLAVTVWAVSCIPSSVIRGSGREANGTFDISPDYTSLDVSSGIVVELVDSLTTRGFITADEDVLDHVMIVREGGRVKVSYEPLVSVHSDITTVVKMPLSALLEEVDASSAARVVSTGRLLCGSLDIECSSAATVDLDIDGGELSIELSSAASFSGNVAVRSLEVDMSSASHCNIDGSADTGEVEANSAAAFRGLALVCGRADVEASSGGIVEISATNELNAGASSGGRVEYKGTPSIMRREQSSGGSIREVR